MKTQKTLLLTCAMAMFVSTHAQIQFQDHTIIDNSNATDGAISVFATDLDGDGDMDVLSASLVDNYVDDDKIAWYENTDGLGTFGPQQIITTEADGASSVFAADIDGDGDMDVLSASWYDDKIAWYENTDGQGTFGPQQIITTEADFADRKSTRLNSSHTDISRMPSSA